MKALPNYWHKSGPIVVWSTHDGHRVYVKRVSKGRYKIQIDHEIRAVAKGQANAKEIAIKLATKHG